MSLHDSFCEKHIFYRFNNVRKIVKFFLVLLVFFVILQSSDLVSQICPIGFLSCEKYSTFDFLTGKLTVLFCHIVL